MKYFFIVFFLVAIVVVNVWQNIEVIKIEMEYKRKIALEKKLIKQRDLLVYKIEKQRTITRIERFAEHNPDIKELGPGDYDVLKVVDGKKND